MSITCHKLSRLFLLLSSLSLIGKNVALAQACGSILTANTTLAANIGPCPGNGLTMFGPVTLDLNGFTITGQGQGNGVTLQSGATVRGPGSITGFAAGVRSNTPTPHQDTVVRTLNLRRNTIGVVTEEGTSIRILGNTITGNQIGLAIELSSAKIKNNVITHNSQIGIRVFDQGPLVSVVSNTVNHNGQGMTIDFADPDFSNDVVSVLCNDFSGSKGDGVTMRGTNITFETNMVQGNGGDGVVLSSHGSFAGGGNLLQDNNVSANAKRGIAVIQGDGPAPNQIIDNRLSGNGNADLFWDLIGTNSCWKLNDSGTSNPGALPVCP